MSHSSRFCIGLVAFLSAFNMGASGCLFGSSADLGSAESVAEANTLANLQGTWRTGCSYLGSGVYIVSTFVVSGSTATESIEGFSTSTCETASSRTMLTSDLVTVGETFENTLGFATYTTRVDFKVASVVLTPLTVTAASNYNSVSFCGLSSWANGTPVDATGLNHSADGCVYPAAGSMIYQTFDLGSSSEGSFTYWATPYDAVEFGAYSSSLPFAISGGSTSSTWMPSATSATFLKQ